MSNINNLIIEIQGKIDIYNLKAENQRNKTAMCYQDNTLSYANWILGLHKDESPNTTKTVYLYTNVCKKSDDGNDSMYKEYLLVRPDKKIDEDGKTLRKHMKEKYEEDEGALENNKKLLEKGRTELNRLTDKLKENETLHNDKVNTLEQKQEELKQTQKELTDKKTKLNEIKTELRDKEEQRDDIMYSLNTFITATPLPYTNDGREDMVQNTNDGREEMDSREEMVQDTNDNYQRTKNIQGGVDDDDNAGPTNEELKKINKDLQHLQQEKTGLEEQFTQINNRIQEQELGIATLEQTITKELENIQTLTQKVQELDEQGVSINNDIKLLDIVSTLEDEIEANQENFENKPNKLYEIKIKDFGDDNVQAVNVLNADYIDIGLLNQDVAYMVGKTPTEDPVIISERDNTKPTSIRQQHPATSENTYDSESTSDRDSDSDTGSDTVSISDIDINIEEEDKKEEDEEDEEAFFHDAPPPLIEHLQIIEDQFKSYDDYKNIQDTTINVVLSIIKEYIRKPFIKIYTGMSLGDLQPTFIIKYLSDALKKKDIEKTDIEKFLRMISDMKESLNEYYNTTDNNEKEILEQLVKKFSKYLGGSVKKQKTKKQKPLRKNNSFRKKRKAKV